MPESKELSDSGYLHIEHISPKMYEHWKRNFFFWFWLYTQVPNALKSKNANPLSLPIFMFLKDHNTYFVATLKKERVFRSVKWFCNGECEC